MGCDKNISRDFRHRLRISFSDSCTFFPGRAPRTEMWRIELGLNYGIGLCGIRLPSSRREIMLSMFMMSDMFRCCAAAANVVVVVAVVAAVDTSACLRCLICLPDFSFVISARAYVFSVYVMYVISSM